MKATLAIRFTAADSREVQAFAAFVTKVLIDPVSPTVIVEESEVWYGWPEPQEVDDAG